MRFAAFLLIIGSLFTASPAYAARIESWESKTKVYASFVDGTALDRIRVVLPTVAPNGNIYDISEKQHHRTRMYRAHSRHCVVNGLAWNVTTGVCDLGDEPFANDKE